MPQIGWSPGIGDPTIGGWITVALYLAATVSAWKTRRAAALAISKNRRDLRDRREPGIWRFIAGLFLFLGINKQLDLQSLFTQIGRLLALSEGWYQRRQDVQVAFILAIAAVFFLAAVVSIIWARRAPLSAWCALMGTAFVLAYVLIRAASFHHIDRFIGQTILGLRWNWVLEMGGISIVLAASLYRHTQLSRGLRSLRA